MFFVYVLKNNFNKEFYTGSTNNLKRRLKEHNDGRNLSTKRYRPWELIYFEGSLNELDAERRETYLKTSQGRRLIKLRLKEYMHE